jgi:hypothetical protein
LGTFEGRWFFSVGRKHWLRKPCHERKERQRADQRHTARTRKKLGMETYVHRRTKFLTT